MHHTPPTKTKVHRLLAPMVATGLTAAGIVLASAQPAGAHVGLPAGGAIDGLTHPVLGIDHLLAMVAVGVLAALSRNRTIAWLTPAAFAGGMVVGGTVGLLDVQLPAVELAIAASVVTFGVLVLTSGNQVARWLPVIAAGFGIAHGHAHGAELPAGAVPVAYVAGFVVATVALHASGTALGAALRRSGATRVATGAVIATAGAAMLVGA